MAFPAIADDFFVMSIGRRSEFRIRVNETMTKKNVAEVLVDVLVEAGVERCVTGYSLKEWHVASKRENLARAFVTAALAGQ